MNWRKFWIGLLCAAFVIMLFDSLLAQDRQQRPQRRAPRWAPEIEIGAVVPDFELPVLDSEKPFKLSDFKGKIVVIELGACS
ncbi:hypothetical protein ACFL7D_12145 [candidate division KSB1 bacterium]